MEAAFKAFADPTRREILRILRDGPMSAGAISSRFPLAKATLSGHFAVLKAAGLITVERAGASLIYHLNITVLQDAVLSFNDLFNVGATARKSERP